MAKRKKKSILNMKTPRMKLTKTKTGSVKGTLTLKENGKTRKVKF